MHGQVSDIPSVVLLTGLEIKSRVLFVGDLLKLRSIQRRDLLKMRTISGSKTLVHCSLFCKLQSDIIEVAMSVTSVNSLTLKQSKPFYESVKVIKSYSQNTLITHSIPPCNKTHALVNHSSPLQKLLRWCCTSDVMSLRFISQGRAFISLHMSHVAFPNDASACDWNAMNCDLRRAAPDNRVILQTDIDLLQLPCSSVTIPHQSIPLECHQFPRSGTLDWSMLVMSIMVCLFWGRCVICMCQVCVTHRGSARRLVPCLVRHARQSAREWLSTACLFIQYAGGKVWRFLLLWVFFPVCIHNIIHVYVSCGLFTVVYFIRWCPVNTRDQHWFEHIFEVHEKHYYVAFLHTSRVVYNLASRIFNVFHASISKVSKYSGNIIKMSCLCLGNSKHLDLVQYWKSQYWLTEARDMLNLLWHQRPSLCTHTPNV